MKYTSLKILKWDISTGLLKNISFKILLSMLWWGFKLYNVYNNNNNNILKK